MTVLARRLTWATMQEVTTPTLNNEFQNIVDTWNQHDQALSKWTKISTSGTLNVDGTTTFNTATYTWPSSLPGASSILQTTSGGTLSWVTSSTAYAPLGSPYVTIGNDGTLTAERALTGTSNQIIITDNGANNTVVLSTPQSIATSSNVTFNQVTVAAAYVLSGSALYLGGSTFGHLFNDNANTINIVRCDNSGNVVIAEAALATNATNRFFYISSCAGTPTGTPTSYTGRIPMVYDSTNNKIYFYNGSWRSVAVT